MRTVICVDAPSKGKLFRYSLVACACDAKNHIFPVEYAVVELENKDSWFWFLVQTRGATVDMECDRQKGFTKAVPCMLPCTSQLLPSTLSSELLWDDKG